VLEKNAKALMAEEGIAPSASATSSRSTCGTRAINEVEITLLGRAA